jgi:hypothetical protein
MVGAAFFPGVERVDYPRRGSARVRSYVDWVLAGRDDAIAIAARYGALGKLPDALAEFMRSTRIELIHANHVLTMRLAQRIAGIAQGLHGRRPRIVLDTHDVLSETFVERQLANKLSGRLDSYESLLKTELTLSSQADLLIHLTEPDFDFFASRLRGRAHALVLPTLHPDTEVGLVQRRGLQRPAEFGLIHVATSHGANVETVRWLRAR